MSAKQPHISVLLDEVVTALAPRNGAIFVDGTFGAGGYSKALLEAAPCRVFGIDRDPSAVATGQELAQRYDGRFDILGGCFGDMEALLAEKGVASVDGVTLDLGVSSMQIDQAERGFSFQKDGPLDMRMSSSGPSAADLVNSLPEGELADILWRYGEERHSRRIARAIVTDRQKRPFTRTLELAGLIERVAPSRGERHKHPATRVFQALRIHVNRELAELETALEAARARLAPEGRLAVISFHSLEDRMVKRFMREHAQADPMYAGLPHIPPHARPTLRLVGKSVEPDAAEIASNPRARSARLRVAERLPQGRIAA